MAIMAAFIQGLSQLTENVYSATCVSRGSTNSGKRGANLQVHVSRSSCGNHDIAAGSTCTRLFQRRSAAPFGTFCAHGVGRQDCRRRKTRVTVIYAYTRTPHTTDTPVRSVTYTSVTSRRTKNRSLVVFRRSDNTRAPRPTLSKDEVIERKSTDYMETIEQ